MQSNEMVEMNPGYNKTTYGLLDGCHIKYFAECQTETNDSDIQFGWQILFNSHYPPPLCLSLSIRSRFNEIGIKT